MNDLKIMDLLRTKSAWIVKKQSWNLKLFSLTSKILGSYMWIFTVYTLNGFEDDGPSRETRKNNPVFEAQYLWFHRIVYILVCKKLGYFEPKR